jgi:manganese transport protein
VALLASGQSSTITGTLAGQIVMEGFLRIRIRPWLRRLITRLLAIGPAVLLISASGGKDTVGLLVFSQVVLSMQLSFAIFPLMKFTSDRKLMGEFANPLWAKILGYAICTLIASLNGAPPGAGHRLDGRAGRNCRRLHALGTLRLQGGLTVYSTILVALENSKTDEAILAHIEQLAKLTGARLLFVHVADGWVARTREQFNLAESVEMKEDRAYLESVRRLRERAGSRPTRSPPASRLTIVKLPKNAVDLIAMSTHGHRFLADLILGSTANKVRHVAEVPVLLVRAPR